MTIMSINNSSIKDGATAITMTGGTDITLVSSGAPFAGVVEAYVSNDTSMKTRRTVKFTSKAPKANPKSLGGYTQAYRKVEVLFPRTLETGEITYDAVLITHRSDISATDAEITNQLMIGAQILGDADFASFFKALNLN
jgi:hypothetical protein